MKVNFLKSITILSLTSVMFISCQEDDSNLSGKTATENYNSVNENDPYVQKILAMGFNIKNIKELKDFYLVESDIMFPKDGNISGTAEKSAQAHANSLVSMENITTIKVAFHNSLPISGNDNWRDAIAAAMNDWNSITGSRVNFIMSDINNYDIIIGADQDILSNGVPASAYLPALGKPGYQIIINLDAADNRVFSESEKKHIIKHELGHTIGFCHTNGPLRGEHTDAGGFNTILYTPNGFGSNQDPDSVMNTATPLSFIFSNYDLYAVRYLYPEIYSMNEMISYPLENASIYGSGGFDIFWRASFILNQDIKMEVFLENVLVHSSIQKNDGNAYIGNYGDGQYKIKISSPSNSSSFDIVTFYYVND
ncbi:M57 family metalloprotease [Flavobacterium quisquiliarum]|uniref:M57 family metalloprotease n=1 Tax=Flavobacterium quisquiliarum TaxID=1834436 RepID=A0ABV8W6P0_9FLAO|nr:M57 family metalloprotease [Flavobacterium quisquiliarum]MBW1656315.1 hypothetical protein [Flavobacterium quisquiliarum]NWL04019.1 hypothetical protein [Flavobacterium collinsii]